MTYNLITDRNNLLMVFIAVVCWCTCLPPGWVNSIVFSSRGIYWERQDTISVRKSLEEDSGHSLKVSLVFFSLIVNVKTLDDPIELVVKVLIWKYAKTKGSIWTLHYLFIYLFFIYLFINLFPLHINNWEIHILSYVRRSMCFENIAIPEWMGYSIDILLELISKSSSCEGVV